MALDSGYWETSDNTNMEIDDVAALLVKLYADYRYYAGECDDYAKAVAIAVRMLSD